MAFPGRISDQIKAMLGAMTFSQRALIVALVVIIAGCVGWLVTYAGRPDYAPVFNQQFDSPTQGRQVAVLKAAGMDAEIRQGKVVVPAGSQDQARQVLAIGDALPADFSFGFEQIVNDSNIWRSESEKERLWKVAVENELANVLRRFPGVHDAKVIVDRPDRTGFGRSADHAGSAAVHLRMKPQASIDKKLVAAVADWVSGAVRNVPRERVKLVDSTSGRSYRVPSEDAAVPADLLELTKQYEEHFATGILKAIGHIDSVLVSVSVKVDPASKRETAVAIDKDKSVSLVSEESSSKVTAGEATGTGGEPGVAANTGAVITSGSLAAGPRRSESDDKTAYDTRFGERRTETALSAGALRELSAAVNIPRSYFLAAFKAETGQDANDQAALKDFIARESAQVKTKVLAAVGLGKADEDKVAVGWYYDTPATASPPGPTTEPAGTIAVLRANARTIGLGAAAAVCLAVMVLMMRKAAGAVAPAPPAAGAAAVGGTAEGVVSRASIADDYLPGVEVDAETLRTQRMVEQVGELVRGKPDAAANLVRRWIAKKTK